MISEPVSVKRYVVMFSGLYVSLALMLGALLSWMNIEKIGNLNVGILVVSTMFTGFQFVRTNGRVLSQTEFSRLVFGCILVDVVIQVLAALPVLTKASASIAPFLVITPIFCAVHGVLVGILLSDRALKRQLKGV